jgi:hypothetical protein
LRRFRFGIGHALGGEDFLTQFVGLLVIGVLEQQAIDEVERTLVLACLEILPREAKGVLAYTVDGLSFSFCAASPREEDDAAAYQKQQQHGATNYKQLSSIYHLALLPRPRS